MLLQYFRAVHLLAPFLVFSKNSVNQASTQVPFVEEVHFGTYLADQQAAIGGFLPVWSAPFDPIRATIDLGLMVEWISDQLPLSPGENGCLAVLHNRNDMVGAFEVQTKAIFRVISFQPLHYLFVTAKRINTLFSLIVFVRVPNAKQPRR